MVTNQSIDVELPEGLAASPTDRAVLKAECEAVMALHHERSPEFRENVHALEDAGWTIRWRLGWHVTAKRGSDFEEASGRTLEEALSGVTQLVRADSADRWP